MSVEHDHARVDDALFRGLRGARLTWALVVLLVAVHLALGLVMRHRGRTDWVGVLFEARGPRLLARAGAMRAPDVDQGELWRLASAMFLHGDALHLGLNALALVALGRLCEAVYGPLRFGWLFLLAGIGGASLSWVGGNPSTVGASGAIFGLMGAAIVFGWRYRDRLDGETGAFFRLRLLPWAGLNLVIGLVVPVIDNLGHAGGLVTGAILGAVLGNRVVPGEESGRVAHVGMAVGCLGVVGAAVWGVVGSWGVGGS